MRYSEQRLRVRQRQLIGLVGHYSFGSCRSLTKQYLAVLVVNGGGGMLICRVHASAVPKTYGSSGDIVSNERYLRQDNGYQKHSRDGLNPSISRVLAGCEGTHITMSNCAVCPPLGMLAEPQLKRSALILVKWCLQPRHKSNMYPRSAA